MSHRFVRCPHCKLPHEAAERVCPTTGLRIVAEPPRARMPEIPPPERRPAPLAFDARDRVVPPPPPPGAREHATRATGSLSTRDLIGRTIGERYLVRNVLGEGGMGTVFDAEHLGLGRSVAIKVLSPSQAKKKVAVKRFQQEARAAGAIGHPNICEVYDLGLLEDGSPYLVMEKLIGATLAERISKEGGLPFEEIVDVMMQVLGGLIAAHEKGIVHRDIKPENIFLSQRAAGTPIVKILDFGVSKMMPQFQGGEEQLELTRTGMVMGTPYYMSPEQARGERNLDGRVDVYACGVMMYETIAGKRPYLAPNYNALLLAIINTLPVALREIRPSTPPAIEAIVIRAMAKARDQRYPTALHMLREIQATPIAKARRTQMRSSPRPGPAAPIAVPPPPTAAERLRAPVLGGRRDETPMAERRPIREPQDHPEGPGATLKSRMTDAHRAGHGAGHGTRQGAATEPRSEPRGSDTRVDRRSAKGPEPGAIPGTRPAASARAADFVDEMPTEVFRPDMMPPRFSRPGAPPPLILSESSAARMRAPLHESSAGSVRAPLHESHPGRIRAPLHESNPGRLRAPLHESNPGRMRAPLHESSVGSTRAPLHESSAGRVRAPLHESNPGRVRAPLASPPPPPSKPPPLPHAGTLPPVPPAPRRRFDSEDWETETIVNQVEHYAPPPAPPAPPAPRNKADRATLPRAPYRSDDSFDVDLNQVPDDPPPPRRRR